MIRTPDPCPICGYDMNYKGHVNCPSISPSEFWKDPNHNKLMAIISGNKETYSKASKEARAASDEQFLKNIGIELKP